MPLAAGEYTVKATRLGYKPAEEKVAVVAGETKQFSLTLERTSSVVFVVTVPPDVEVVVDGLVTRPYGCRCRSRRSTRGCRVRSA